MLETPHITRLPLPLPQIAPNPLGKFNHKHRKIRFTPEQDAVLKSLVDDNPMPNWNEIAKSIPGKSPKQCRERYQNFLSPELIKQPWNPMDDARLYHCFHYYGSNWAKIAQLFPGRTNNDVKNRYNGHIKNKELDVFLAAINSNLNT